MTYKIIKKEGKQKEYYFKVFKDKKQALKEIKELKIYNPKIDLKIEKS